MSKKLWHERAGNLQFSAARVTFTKVVAAGFLMHWAVAAPFITERTDRGWLTPFVPAGRHQFTLVPTPLRHQDWHYRASRVTGSDEWKDFWHQAGAAIEASEGGIIAVFPQLAATIGLRQRLRLSHRPTVAWSFNLGQVYDGMKRRLSRFALARVDRFIVHARREIDIYSKWLKVPRERFCFVPVQRPHIIPRQEEDQENPFVLAMGSAVRDYDTLFQAVKKLNLATVVVVAAPHAVKGLEIPSNVRLLSSLSQEECYALAQRARVNVVPIANQETASGQVTVIDAMMMGRPVIATRCIGTEDYVRDGETGLLVGIRSVSEMVEALDRLWNDESLRRRMGQSAQAYAHQHFSDEAAGAALGGILDALTKDRPD